MVHSEVKAVGMARVAPRPSDPLGAEKQNIELSGDSLSEANTQGQADGRAPSEIGVWDRLAFTVTHAFATLLLKILGLRGMYRFGRLFGTLEWATNFKRRRRFHIALGVVWERSPSRAERRRECLEYFRQSRCDRLFYLIFDRIPRETANRLLTITNQPLLDSLVARGKGVHVVNAHQGAFHVMGLLMPLHGYKVAGVRDRHEGAIRRFVQDRFDRVYPEFGRARILFANSFPREMYRCFEEGYLLSTAIDISRIRDPRQRVEEGVLFGQKRYFPTGPMRIALRCGAPIVQAFVVPERDFRYRLEIFGLITEPDSVSDESAVIREAIREYAQRSEAHLKAHPSLLTRLLDGGGKG